MKPLRLALWAVLLLALGCSQSPIEKAVKGKLLASEENLVVTNHCQGCHVHSRFKPEVHITRMQKTYPKISKLREMNRCLQCHVLRLKNLFRDEFRSTSRPHGKTITLSRFPPRPSAQGIKVDLDKDADKPAKKKKKRRWYFFYLF